MRWTERDLARINALRDAIQTPLAPRKYRNVPTEFQGLKFDSKHELEIYRGLKLREAAGEIRAVVRQVSMQLPGTKRRIRIDFMLVHLDGRIEFADAKGWETAAWSLKRQQVKDAFGIDIQLL